MFLNTIQPTEGAAHTSRHVGRGVDSSLGETGGHDHKGQKSCADGSRKVDFEDGQVSLQHHLPKRGFKSLIIATNAGVRLSELSLIAVNEIDVLILKQAGLIPMTVSNVKVIVSGGISEVVTLKGARAAKGAKTTIEAIGGKVEE